MTDFDVIAARQAQLSMFLDEVRLLDGLEDHFKERLRQVREQRARAGGFVYAIIYAGEQEPYTAEQWRQLMGSRTGEIAHAIGTFHESGPGREALRQRTRELNDVEDA